MPDVWLTATRENREHDLLHSAHQGLYRTVDTVTHNRGFAELEIEGTENPCSYLPAQTARMVYRLAYRLSADRYEQLLERGWRRFGRTLFRPACAACRACQSLRVQLGEFRATKSQRRCETQNADLTLVIQRPSVTREHIELYNQFHHDMHTRRGWPFREMDEQQYVESFLEGQFPFAREFQYRLHGRLVGLGLVDVTPDVMSSIYFFHAPELRPRGLGTFSVLKEIADGRECHRRWLYLGYYIRECGSMSYKNRFRPHQILSSCVADSDRPDWQVIEP